MPRKDMKAIPIKPVSNMVIPNPFSPSGTCEYFIFSLMAAMATMAKKKPTPEENPKTVASDSE